MKQAYLIFHRLIVITIITAGLHGCAAVAVGGAATTAAVISDRRTTGTVVEDKNIELKARQLIYEKLPDLRDKIHLNITSYNLRVLLTGEVPNADDKQKIVDIVGTLTKVDHIYDEITIAAPSSVLARSNDSVLTSKVKTKMLAADDLPGNAIKVVTESSVVYLMGLVTRTEADRATDIARQTSGVQKVVKLFQYTD